MKTRHIVATAAAVLVMTSAAQARTQYRVDCGAMDVILTEEQVEVITTVMSVTDTTSQEYAEGVCAMVADVDASEFADPTDVTVMMPNGEEVEVQVQMSQQ